MEVTPSFLVVTKPRSESERVYLIRKMKLRMPSIISRISAGVQLKDMGSCAASLRIPPQAITCLLSVAE